ncbi:MAG TPA: hypothetical protein VHV83_15170 [Armatimonadota bacterium]|nr:hypothetical protein [Armatimonadota bacterium]
MLTGIFFALATGVAWAIIGVLYSYAAKKGMDIIRFQLAINLLSCVVSWAGLCHWPALLHGEIPRWQAFIPVMLIAGALNITGMILMTLAMRYGHQAGAWTIGQSAMVVPFLAGILFWHDQAHLMNLLGVACCIGGIILFGQKQQEQANTTGKSWFVLALAAFAVVGISQTCTTVPSHWSQWIDTAALRVPLTNTGGLLAVSLALTANRSTMPHQSAGKLWITAALCAIVAVLGQITLYAGMDYLAKVNQVAIVYPISVSVCVLGFVAYSRLFLHERLGVAGRFATCLGVLGLILMRLS